MKIKEGLNYDYSSFALLIYGEAEIFKAPIRVEGVNRNSYIIFFQGI